jgi:trk system potassium uptake protein TrkH
MFIGGASGSTAGGVKLTTVAIILIAVLSEIRGHPEPETFHRRIPIPSVMRAMTVVTLFFLIHFLMTLALSATEHLYGARPPFVSILFEVMSAQATVGLSTGITPEISTPGKLILVLTMFIGRLGPLTLAYALAQHERAARYRFPPTTVHIG